MEFWLIKSVLSGQFSSMIVDMVWAPDGSTPEQVMAGWVPPRNETVNEINKAAGYFARKLQVIP